MTAKEWLETMKQAADYNPAMTKLIKKYGEMLLDEQNVANKNFIKPDVIKSVCRMCGKERNINMGLCLDCQLDMKPIP